MSEELKPPSICYIVLPKITDDMIEQFYPWLIADDGDGYKWNQAAVDFACLLKSACYERRRSTGKAEQ